MKESTLRIRIESKKSIGEMKRIISETLTVDEPKEAKEEFIRKRSNILCGKMLALLPVAETHTGIENVFKCQDALIAMADDAIKKINNR